MVTVIKVRYYIGEQVFSYTPTYDNRIFGSVSTARAHFKQKLNADRVNLYYESKKL